MNSVHKPGFLMLGHIFAYNYIRTYLKHQDARIAAFEGSAHAVHLKFLSPNCNV